MIQSTFRLEDLGMTSNLTAKAVGVPLIEVKSTEPSDLKGTTVHFNSSSDEILPGFATSESNSSLIVTSDTPDRTDPPDLSSCVLRRGVDSTPPLFPSLVNNFNLSTSRDLCLTSDTTPSPSRSAEDVGESSRWTSEPTELSTCDDDLSPSSKLVCALSPVVVKLESDCPVPDGGILICHSWDSET